MVFQNIYPFWGYQKCPRTRGLFAHAPRKAEIVLWNSCTDSLRPNGPRQRRKLFTAALKLLWFAIGIETVCCENDEQRALKIALLPLLHRRWTRSSYFECDCVGSVRRTYRIGYQRRVWSRQTRSAAALLAGLLVFDPSLQLMVLTKENVAAHAVAEHLVSLNLPDRIQGKMGRLVG